MNRLRNFNSLLKKQKLDGYLVTKDVNIKYLTQFPASESWLLVTPKKCIYITDFRYFLEAKKGLKGIASIACYKGSIYHAVGELCKSLKIKRLGVDEDCLSVTQHRAIKRKLPKGASLIGANGLVETLREIKDSSEILKVKNAIKFHKKTHAYLRRVVRPGLTEREVFMKLEQFVKSRGAGFSFDPIIASGPNSALPHAPITDRKIRRNEPLLIDMGIDLNGYKSDLTRMFYLGKIPEPFIEVHNHVLAAQQLAISYMKDGVPVSEVDQQARHYLKRQNLDQYFGHALGHGVGLEIHEDPRLSQASKAILREGMIVTVEPAVYLPNKFGIRLEEMVLITKKGCKVISAHIN